MSLQRTAKHVKILVKYSAGRYVIEHEFLTLLRCPQSGAPLKLSPDGTQLLCTKNHIAYPIVDNVPILKISSAQPYSAPTKNETS